MHFCLHADLVLLQTRFKSAVCQTKWCCLHVKLSRQTPTHIIHVITSEAR